MTTDEVAVPSDAAHAGPDAARRSTDRALASGIAWVGGMKWGAQAISWAATLVVARLLTPTDYGIVGMAAIYLGLVTMLSEFGIGTAILALLKLPEEKIRQAHSLAAGFGIVGLGLSCAVAWPLGRFFDSEELPPVVIAMSLTFAIAGFRSVPTALLQKSFRFRDLALIDGVQALTSAATAVTLAALGFRYWALVIAAVLGSLVNTGINAYLRPVRLAWPRWRTISDVVGFSGFALTGRLSWFVYSNADFAVVGKVLGAAALGAYNIAWTIASVPIEKITALVGSVTPAFFSASQEDPAALRRYLLTLTEILALVTFPTAVGLALVAADFVPVVLGPQWSKAVVPLQVLACYASIRTIQPLASQVLMMTGEIRFNARLGILTAIMMAAGFYYASRWGIEGVAVAWVVLYPLHFLAVYIRVRWRIQCSAASMVRSVWPAVSGCLAMTAAVLAARGTLGEQMAAPARLALEVAAGAIVYPAFVLVAHRDRVRRFRAILADLRR